MKFPSYHRGLTVAVNSAILTVGMSRQDAMNHLLGTWNITLPGERDQFPSLIIAADGTWERPGEVHKLPTDCSCFA